MNNDSFMYKLGYAIGCLVFGCIALCLAAVLIALTAKFIFWLI